MPLLPLGDRGKMRARDEGPGKADGILLDLKLVGDGLWSAAYTVPVTIGEETYSLQVDTGSSDMWVASTSCSTDPCKATKGNTYDPSNAQPTNRDFNINYLIGNVSGPIVWDAVTVGGYNIDYQAFSAATYVANEPLSPNFSGILGLALPANSIIAREIIPTISDTPDGATFASNLFGITPTSDAPSSRFMSLSLERPGSDRVPSLLGIGRHPSSLVPDPARIKYSRLVTEAVGAMFWKTNVLSLSVWVDGQERQVDIGRSQTGSIFPTAVLDSGVPVILTTSAIANGIYGAVGVGPGADGNYYIPCDKPINMSITIDSATIPIHPLDVTARASSDVSGSTCIGLIQAADGPLINGHVGEFILGVPFLRNTYTVFAYTQPNADGTFPALAAGADIAPRLGVLPLTDPQVAMDEFTTVRVNKQPLSTNSSSSSHDNGAKKASGGGIPLGVKVFIGIAGFFVFCGLMFLVRWLLARRKFGKSGTRTPNSGEYAGDDKKAAMYGLARRNSGGYGAASLSYADHHRSMSIADVDDTIRGSADVSKWDRGSKALYPTSSRGSATTRFGDSHDDDHLPRASEFGARDQTYGDPWDPHTALPAGTVSSTAHRRTASELPLIPPDGGAPLSPPLEPRLPGHERRPSDAPLLAPEEAVPEAEVWHGPTRPIALPTRPSAAAQGYT